MGSLGRRAFAPAVVLAALGLSACITDQGTVQLASVRSPEALRGMDVGVLPVLREVIGRDTRVTSILFVPTFDAPRLESAVADALDKGGADVLVGVHARTIEYWLLVGWSVLEVRGDVVDPGARGAVR
jgi:hypothetical protein